MHRVPYKQAPVFFQRQQSWGTYAGLYAVIYTDNATQSMAQNIGWHFANSPLAYRTHFQLCYLKGIKHMAGSRPQLRGCSNLLKE